MPAMHEVRKDQARPQLPPYVCTYIEGFEPRVQGKPHAAQKDGNVPFELSVLMGHQAAQKDGNVPFELEVKQQVAAKHHDRVVKACKNSKPHSRLQNPQLKQLKPTYWRQKLMEERILFEEPTDLFQAGRCASIRPVNSQASDKPHHSRHFERLESKQHRRYCSSAPTHLFQV